MRTEHYYTSRGRQRAVFLGSDVAKFVLEVMQGDAAGVEVSFEPEEVVRRGKGVWEPFEGGPGGGLHGVTALRVDVQRVDGWVRLIVERNGHE